MSWINVFVGIEKLIERVALLVVSTMLLEMFLHCLFAQSQVCWQASGSDRFLRSQQLLVIVLLRQKVVLTSVVNFLTSKHFTFPLLLFHRLSVDKVLIVFERLKLSNLVDRKVSILY